MCATGTQTHLALSRSLCSTRALSLLWVVPANRDIKPEDVKKLTPWAYFAVTWTHEDEMFASATIGDCASQARWEFYMLLVAVLTWQGVLFPFEGHAPSHW